jgi:hypothetical protein
VVKILRVPEKEIELLQKQRQRVEVGNLRWKYFAVSVHRVFVIVEKSMNRRIRTCLHPYSAASSAGC